MIKLDLKQLEDMKASVKNLAMRKAVSKAAGLVKAAMQSNAPYKTGALAKSMRIRVRRYQNGLVWTAIVGTSSAYKRMKKGRLIKPNRYAPLLEKGTSKMSARPYVKRTLNQTRQTYMIVLQNEISRRLAG